MERQVREKALDLRDTLARRRELLERLPIWRQHPVQVKGSREVPPRGNNGVLLVLIEAIQVQQFRRQPAPRRIEVAGKTHEETKRHQIHRSGAVQIDADTSRYGPDFVLDFVLHAGVLFLAAEDPIPQHEQRAPQLVDEPQNVVALIHEALPSGRGVSTDFLQDRHERIDLP